MVAHKEGNYDMHYKQLGGFRKRIQSNHLLRKTSMQSRIIEKGMALVNKHKSAEAEKISLEKLKAKENPYEIPGFIKRKYGIQRFVYADMPVYYLAKPNQVRKQYILYLHGGAYIHEPSIFHWRFVYQLTEEMPATVIVPLYPKAPYHTCIKSYTKLLLFYRQLVSELGAENIVLMGDSAGGGFALGFAQYLLEKSLPQPKQIILISPWLDITLTNKEIEAYKSVEPMLSAEALRIDGAYYAGDVDLRHYMLSPINGPLKGLAPISIFVGTHEIFLPDVRVLKKRLESLQVAHHYFEYPFMNHIFTTYPIPEAKIAIKQIAQLIKELT